MRTFLHVTRSADNMVRMHLPDIGIYNEWTVDAIQQLKLYADTDSSNAGTFSKELQISDLNLAYPTCHFKDTVVFVCSDII